jgi:enoyl-CoA hydratase/carnithine racemase
MIEESIDSSLLWLTLSRPKAANALDQSTHTALVQALERAAQNPSVGAVIITAAGDRVFSAGADLKEFSELGQQKGSLKRRDLLLKTLDALLDFPKPLLACVQAAAVGAGAMLALACDEIVFADSAWLSFPEVTFDLPSPMGVAILNRRATQPLIHRIVQTGVRLDAHEARAANLVDEVVASDSLRAACAARALECAKYTNHAYGVNKRWINRTVRAELARAAENASANHRDRKV